MKTRDEYVGAMKSEIERCNAQVTMWEAQARDARVELRASYARQLEALRARREEALYNLKLIEGASALAWSDLARGADEAWMRMQEAVAAARTHFESAR